MPKTTAGELTVYTDGGSRGNPGQAAYAFLVVENGKVRFSHSAKIGMATNNEAEYNGVINALLHARATGAKRIKLYSDSELVIRQLLGEYKVKKGHLQELYARVKELEADFEKVEYANVPRENEFIAKADLLVNQTLDSV